MGVAQHLGCATLLSLCRLCLVIFPLTKNMCTFFLFRPSICSPAPDFQCQRDLSEPGVEPPAEQGWPGGHLLQRGVQALRGGRAEPLPLLWQWGALQPPAERPENHQSLHHRPPGTHQLHL